MQQRAVPRSAASNVQGNPGRAPPSAADRAGSLELDELGRIDAEYGRRLTELLEWRLQETERAKARYAHADFSVGSNQFQVANGRNACTAAAVSAALYVLNYIASQDVLEDETETMVHLPWEDIVQTGAWLWSEYAASDAAQERGPDAHVECGELLSCGGVKCSTVHKALHVVEEMAGHTDSAVVAAMDPDSIALSLSGCVDKIRKRTAAVITATSANAFASDDNMREATNASTIVVMRLASDNYWIYDSHGGTTTQQAALLCLRGNVEAASAVVREQLPSGLYSATLYKRNVARSR